MKKVICLLSIAMLMVGCNQEKTTTVPKKTSDPELITPSPTLRSTIKTAFVKTEPIKDLLSVAARIDFDEQQLARIGTTVTGRVTQIDARLGQSVKKGEVLARINSSELSNQQLAYLKARAQLELNRRNATRAQLLYDSDVIAAAELERRKSEYQISQAETHAAADQLHLLGVSSGAVAHLGKKGIINSVTPVMATIDGVVVDRKLAQGQVVQPADTLFSIANLSQVWVVAQVPEQQISRVRMGQSVTIQIPALNHEKKVGKLIFVDHKVHPETRTVLVRTELNNTDLRLKPEMLASMLIETESINQLVIPTQAVVRENDEDYVFVMDKTGAFRLKKVKLGAEQGGKRIVQSGLKEQEQIVTEGAFHLNTERNRREMEGV